MAHRHVTKSAGRAAYRSDVAAARLLAGGPRQDSAQAAGNSRQDLAAAGGDLKCTTDERAHSAASGMIWHVIGWELDFEPDFAKTRGQGSPLAYVKLHIRHARQDAQQLDLQWRIFMGTRDGREAMAIYTGILRAAGNRADHRGYLWNHKGLPASPAEIGIIIGAPQGVVRKALAALAGVFMEQVPSPMVRYVPDPPLPRGPAGGAPGTGQPAAQEASKPGSPGGDPVLRAPCTGNAGLSCAGHAAGGGTATGTETATATATATPNVSTATGNRQTGNEKEEAATAAEPASPADGTAGNGNADGKADGDAGTMTEQPPTAAVPSAGLPTETDPGEGRNSLGGGILDNEATLKFEASKVYLALYPDEFAVMAAAKRGGDRGTPITTSEFESRELGMFTSMLCAVACLGLENPVIEGVLRKSIRQAERLAKRRRPARKTSGALWGHWLRLYMGSLVGPSKWAGARRGLATRRYLEGETTGPPGGTP